MVTEPPQLHGHRKEPERVTLNGVVYNLTAPVSRFLASSFPQKVVFGDYSEESHPLVSTITWDDFSDGMLKNTIVDPADYKRSYFNNLNVSHKGHITKPVGNSGVGFGDSDSGSEVAAMFVAEYQPSSATSPLLYYASASFNIGSITPVSTVTYHTLESSATDFHAGPVGGMTVLVAPQANRVSWTRSDTTITTWFDDSSEKITHVTTWRGVLWGVNASGELFFTPDVSSASLAWTKVAQADLRGRNNQRGLLVGPDDKLYLSSKSGLHRYDNENEQFNKVFEVPGSSDGGRGATVWQGSIFWAQGLSVWRFTPTFNGNIAEPIGLNLDDGLVQNRLGSITALGHTVDRLYALVKPQTDSVQYPALYEWNERGWNEKYVPQSINTLAPTLKVGNFVYAGALASPGQTGYHVMPAITEYFGTPIRPNLPRLPAKHDWVTPDNLDSNWTIWWELHNDSATASIAPSSQKLVTPWVSARGQQQWTALSVTVAHSFHALNSSLYGQSSIVFTDSNDVEIQYGTDYQSSFTSLGKIFAKSDSFGEKAFKVGNTDEGVPFDAIRFKILMSSSTDSNARLTPDINKLSFNFRKNPDPLWGYRLIIDTANFYQNRSPKQVQQDLVDLFSKKELLEFAFKDGRGDTQTTRVVPINLEAQEGTGLQNEGVYVLTVSEVQ